MTIGSLCRLQHNFLKLIQKNPYENIKNCMYRLMSKCLLSLSSFLSPWIHNYSFPFLPLCFLPLSGGGAPRGRRGHYVTQQSRHASRAWRHDPHRLARPGPLAGEFIAQPHLLYRIPVLSDREPLSMSSAVASAWWGRSHAHARCQRLRTRSFVCLD